MRLYQAKTLDEYIAQLKMDVEVLERVSRGSKITGALPDVEFYTQNRDTMENHSEIMSTHHDNLRRERIERKRNGQL